MLNTLCDPLHYPATASQLAGARFIVVCDCVYIFSNRFCLQHFVFSFIYRCDRRVMCSDEALNLLSIAHVHCKGLNLLLSATDRCMIMVHMMRLARTLLHYTPIFHFPYDG